MGKPSGSFGAHGFGDDYGAFSASSRHDKDEFDYSGGNVVGFGGAQSGLLGVGLYNEFE